jgi:HD superfamily phosphohydrolase
MSQKIIRDKTSDINSVLRNSGISDREISEIADMILGENKRKSFLGEIIHWMVDADKLDYLPRDSYSTGFLSSLVQSTPIIDSMKLFNDHMVFEKKAIPYLESMIFAETIYYSNIHHHPTVRKADQTLSRAIKIAIEKGTVTPPEVQRMTDKQIISFLKKAEGKESHLVTKIQNKPLHTILTINWEDLDKDTINQVLKIGDINQKSEKLENAIASHINSDPDFIIVDIPSLPYIQEADTPIITDEEEIKPLKSVSNITKAVSENHPTQWSLCIYSEKEYKESTESLRKFLISQI